MIKEITVKEIEKTITQQGNNIEPIIVKRNSESDLIILSVEEYKRRINIARLEKELDDSEEDIKNGNIFRAKDVFNELRQEYGY